MSGGNVCFSLFYKFRMSKEILRQSSYMSHILKGLSKRNMHIPHIALFDEDKWHKRCSNAYFWVFRGGGHFWRVTQASIIINKSVFSLLALAFWLTQTESEMCFIR